MRRSIAYPTILLLVMVCGLAQAQTRQALQEGDRPPNFSITTDHGRRISPSAFGGRLLVLNFWEAGCVPCIKELPSLSDFARKFRPEGVVVIAIGEDGDPSQTKRPAGLETYRDPTRHMGQSFGTYMFPETYIIQDGRIIRKVVGGIDWMSGEMTAFVRERLAMTGGR